MPAARVVEVVTTFPDEAGARACAGRLVERGLAACVHVDGPFLAVYRWEGATAHDAEWRCTCKTSPVALEACIAALVEDHPYRVPQLLWRECDAGGDYAAWVAEQTGGSAADEAPHDAVLAHFDVVLHPRGGAVEAGPPFQDERGIWPTLRPGGPRGITTGVGFDAALAALDAFARASTEPDGAFLWVGEGEGGRWQVDGNAWEREGRILSVDVRGRCPLGELRRFLGLWRAAGEGLLVEFVRAGVYVDEETFLRHAVAPRSGPAGMPERP